MTESESVALPLGDAPIFSTWLLYQKFFRLSITFCKKTKNNFKNLDFFSALCYNIEYLPVAQLDSASDSDSEGQRFKSVRVGHKRAIKKISPQKALIFQGFFAFFGRNFLVRFCRWKMGIFRYWKDLNSRENKKRPQHTAQRKKSSVLFLWQK